MHARSIVGKNIARVRAAKGLSQTQLADRIDATSNMSQAYISKLENGHRNISVDKLAVIAEALDVRLIEFFKED